MVLRRWRGRDGRVVRSCPDRVAWADRGAQLAGATEVLGLVAKRSDTTIPFSPSHRAR
jgi:hypothetical protein